MKDLLGLSSSGSVSKPPTPFSHTPSSNVQNVSNSSKEEALPAKNTDIENINTISSSSSHPNVLNTTTTRSTTRSQSHLHLSCPSSTQNQGNVLGERPCVRRNVIGTRHGGGNAMKALLSNETLQWKGEGEGMGASKSSSGEWGEGSEPLYDPEVEVRKTEGRGAVGDPRVAMEKVARGLEKMKDVMQTPEKGGLSQRVVDEVQKRQTPVSRTLQTTMEFYG